MHVKMTDAELMRTITEGLFATCAFIITLVASVACLLLKRFDPGIVLIVFALVFLVKMWFERRMYMAYLGTFPKKQ